MSEDLTLINQVYIILAPKGVSFEAVKNLDNTTLQEILGKDRECNDLDSIIGFVLEKAPDIADSEALNKNREVRKENGDTIIDEKNGDELAQRTIIHQDGKNIIETVIVYKNGQPSSKTVKKNGNTQERTSYTEESEPFVTDEENNGINPVVIKTSKSDGSTVTTYVIKVDENGNYSDEDFRHRKITKLSGETTYITKKEDGSINVTSDNAIKIYNGSSITGYDKGNLQQVKIENISPKAEPKLEDIYISYDNLYNSMYQNYDRSVLKEESHRQIFDIIANNSEDKILSGTKLLDFIKELLNLKEGDNITYADLQAVSKTLQEFGVENADFKGFLDALILDNSISRVTSTQKTLLSDGSGYRTRTKYDDGRTTIRDFYPNGELKYMYYQGEQGVVDPSVGEEFGGDYIGKTLKARSTVYAYSTKDDTRLVNLRPKEAFSLKFSKQLQEAAIFLFTNENYDVAQMLSGSPNIWECISNLAIEGYCTTSGISSLSDEEYRANRNLRKAEVLISSGGKQAAYYSPETPGYMRLGNVTLEEIKAFEREFQEQFGRPFHYPLANHVQKNYLDYTNAQSLYQSIQNIEDVLSINIGKNHLIDCNKFLTADESIDQIACRLASYGFKVEFVDDSYKIPRFDDPQRTAHVYLSRKDVLMSDGENLKAKYLLTLCDILPSDCPIFSELTDDKYCSLEPEHILFWHTQLLNIEKGLKAQMAAQVAAHTKKEGDVTYSEDATEKYLENLYSKYSTNYTQLFGQAPPNKERIKNMLMVRGVVAQATEMMVVMALTQGLGTAISGELVAGVNAAKTGEEVQGVARMFEWISSKYGNAAAQQFAANLTRTSGAALFPTVSYATAGSEEERQAILKNAPNMFAYGLFGSYISGPFGEKVASAIGREGSDFCAKILNNAISISGEITADTIFMSVAEGENPLASLMTNAHGDIMGRVISMLIGGRANKAANKMQKYKIGSEVQNGQKVYTVEMNGEKVYSTTKPEEIVRGIIAKEVSETIKEDVQLRRNEIIDNIKEDCQISRVDDSDVPVDNSPQPPESRPHARPNAPMHSFWDWFSSGSSKKPSGETSSSSQKPASSTGAPSTVTHTSPVTHETATAHADVKPQNSPVIADAKTKISGMDRFSDAEKSKLADALTPENADVLGKLLEYSYYDDDKGDTQLSAENIIELANLGPEVIRTFLQNGYNRDTTMGPADLMSLVQYHSDNPALTDALLTLKLRDGADVDTNMSWSMDAFKTVYDNLSKLPPEQMAEKLQVLSWVVNDLTKYEGNSMQHFLPTLSNYIDILGYTHPDAKGRPVNVLTHRSIANLLVWEPEKIGKLRAIMENENFEAFLDKMSSWDTQEPLEEGLIFYDEYSDKFVFANVNYVYGARRMVAEIKFDSDGKIIVPDYSRTKTTVNTSGGSIQTERTGYELTKIYRDNDGNTVKQEVFTPSAEIPGEYDIAVYTPDNNGELQGGNVSTIRRYGSRKQGYSSGRRIETPSGIKIRDVKQGGPNGNASEYTIVDKDGNVKFDQKRTHRMWFDDDNHYRSSRTVRVNGREAVTTNYDIVFDGDKVKVSKIGPDGTLYDRIELGPEQLDPRLTDMYKKLPGDYFYHLKENGIKVTADCPSDRSCYDYNTNTIEIDSKSRSGGFVFGHEFGHALDFTALKNLHSDPEFLRIFKTELSQFRKTSTMDENDFIRYYTDSGSDPYGNVAEFEVIAQIEAIVSGHLTGTEQAFQGINNVILEYNFPETIAYIAKKFATG